MQESSRTIVGYFKNRASLHFENFEKIAEAFRDDCQFHAGFG